MLHYHVALGSMPEHVDVQYLQYLNELIYNCFQSKRAQEQNEVLAEPQWGKEQ